MNTMNIGGVTEQWTERVGQKDQRRDKKEEKKRKNRKQEKGVQILHERTSLTEGILHYLYLIYTSCEGRFKQGEEEQEREEKKYQ